MHDQPGGEHGDLRQALRLGGEPGDRDDVCLDAVGVRQFLRDARRPRRGGPQDDLHQSLVPRLLEHARHRRSGHVQQTPDGVHLHVLVVVHRGRRDQLCLVAGRPSILGRCHPGTSRTFVHYPWEALRTGYLRDINHIKVVTPPRVEDHSERRPAGRRVSLPRPHGLGRLCLRIPVLLGTEMTARLETPRSIEKRDHGIGQRGTGGRGTGKKTRDILPVAFADCGFAVVSLGRDAVTTRWPRYTHREWRY